MSTKHTIPADQLIKINEIRNEVRDVLTPDLDTDLNLARWINGLNGNISLASKRIREYIENRRAVNLDTDNFHDQFLTHPIMKKFGGYFPFSVMEAYNPDDNSIVVFQRVENVDFNDLTRVLTCGEILYFHFFMWEAAFQKVLQREAETGKPSGLSVINDLENFSIWPMLNPNAPFNKINKLIINLMQEYYCDILLRCYIVNAPSMAGALWEIMKKIVDPKTREKFVFVRDHEALLNILGPDVIPTAFGGNLKLTDERLRVLNEENVNVNLETCGTIPRTITEKDYFVPKEFQVPVKVKYLKPKEKFDVEVKVEGKKAILWWQFRVNSEIQFGVSRVKQDDQRTLVVPKLTVNTPKLPEQGHLTCEEESCTYILEFTNCSTTWFSLKLEYITCVDSDTDQ